MEPITRSNGTKGTCRTIPANMAYGTSSFLLQNPLLSLTLRSPGRTRSEIPPTTLSAVTPVPVQEIDNQCPDDFMMILC